MNELVIRIKKKRDGSAALSCVRADGTVTWQRQEGAQGRFFPRHDLTHYAVETVLGRARGFYGLLAEGWNLTDFGKPWPRGPLPTEAACSELLVGFLDGERAAGTQWSAADFNSSLTNHFTEQGLSVSCVVTDAELDQVRERRGELFAQWATLPPGETLELRFIPAPGGAEVG
jgi:hypothetical protein